MSAVMRRWGGCECCDEVGRVSAMRRWGGCECCDEEVGRV